MCLPPEGPTEARTRGELQATVPAGRTRMRLTGVSWLPPLVMARKSPEDRQAACTRVTHGSEDATHGVSGITPSVPWGIPGICTDNPGSWD